MGKIALYLRKYLSFMACFAIKSKYNINQWSRKVKTFLDETI
ncbi:hypothetical protein LRLP16767_LR202_01590 [Limosilactobacillus reuteri]|uniref:Uncharacterized protein n=1 Tax=Limosilactobacillus reuteri TaxID=1598 RepID=A0A0U5JWG4_LIMRT|nr:hypothetical protein LRLP16767_LR3C6_01738 [Limosilactobacillus reuteri subsp. porcinus]CUR41613.1 hypothetical protein LRLP16767_LR202_01590 [Limosilactobacillus reuteri]